MSRRLPLLAVCLLALGVSALRPQTAPAARPETPRPAPAERPAPPGQSAAAPTMIENALAAVPEDEPRMEAYSHGRYVLFVVGVFWSIAVLLLIVASGIAGRLQRLAERVTTSANRRVAVTVVLFALLTFVASFPLSVFGFRRERRYGFATQTFAAWLGDEGKGLLVELVLETLFFTILYAAIRRLGRRWWMAGAALGVGFLVLLLAVGPVFIAPLFNTFKPLEDARLREEILAMARAHGIPADEVYQVDSSRQSRHNNAYVAGLLGTQRIVLDDTTLERFTPREIRFVMGHEMGHYVLHHVRRFVVFLSILLIAGIWLVDRIARGLIGRWRRPGIRSLAEPASLPLMLLVLHLLGLPALPAITAFSRVQERAADRFGMEVTRDPAAAASCFVKFGRYDLGEFRVDPWIETLLLSHPSLGNRIREAQAYAREHPETGSGPPAGL